LIRVILNPYGIAYAMGLQGAGTERANPRPLSLSDYVDLVDGFGLSGVEFYTPLLDALDDAGLAHLRDRLASKRQAVVMSQPLAEDLSRSIECARALGAKVIRCHATPVLCGDRSAPGCDWPKHVAGVRRLLAHWAPRLAEHGLGLAIENHQDFTSADLIELCEFGGANVGITFDVGNALSVGEDPVAFARVVAPRLRHIHLKDYRAHWSDEGYRLVRCAIGDGAVPFAEVLKILDRGDVALTAAIEPGALSARHIRLLTTSWWKGYAPRSADSLAAALRVARTRRLAETEDWRTPWEAGAGAEEIVRYEMSQLHKSVENLKEMGLL
jgi:sugar phosphate isomerase/epimerase